MAAAGVTDTMLDFEAAFITPSQELSLAETAAALASPRISQLTSSSSGNMPSQLTPPPPLLPLTSDLFLVVPIFSPMTPSPASKASTPTKSSAPARAHLAFPSTQDPRLLEASQWTQGDDDGQASPSSLSPSSLSPSGMSLEAAAESVGGPIALASDQNDSPLSIHLGDADSSPMQLNGDDFVVMALGTHGASLVPPTFQQHQPQTFNASLRNELELESSDAEENSGRNSGGSIDLDAEFRDRRQPVEDFDATQKPATPAPKRTWHVAPEEDILDSIPSPVVHLPASSAGDDTPPGKIPGKHAKGSAKTTPATPKQTPTARSSPDQEPPSKRRHVRPSPAQSFVPSSLPSFQPPSPLLPQAASTPALFSAPRLTPSRHLANGPIPDLSFALSQSDGSPGLFASSGESTSITPGQRRTEPPHMTSAAVPVLAGHPAGGLAALKAFVAWYFAHGEVGAPRHA